MLLKTFVLQIVLLKLAIFCRFVFISTSTIIHKIFERNPCEIVKYEKVLISVFQQFFASISKYFLGGGLGTRLKFYEVLRFSWVSQFPKILSPKSFDNLWGNSNIPCLLLIIALRFTCVERKIWYNIKKSRIIMNMIVSKTLSFFCMSLLIAPIVKNSRHIYTGIYFIFLKNLLKENLKVFQYQILTSMKRLEKQLASKANSSNLVAKSTKICFTWPWNYKN